MDKTLNSISINTLEQLVEEINSVEVLSPEDITVPKLVELTGKNRNFIERLLMEKVKKKELVKVSCYNPETGRAIIAYRPIGG